MVGLAIVAVVVLVVVVEDADSCYCFSARSAYPQLTIFETKIKGGNSYESHEAAISPRHSLTRCKEEVTGRSLRTLEMRKKVWGAMGRCFVCVVFSTKSFDYGYETKNDQLAARLLVFERNTMIDECSLIFLVNFV